MPHTFLMLSMDPKQMEAAAKFIEAVAAVLWPLLAALVLFALRHRIFRLMESGAELAVEFMGTKVAITPAKAVRSPGAESSPTNDENTLYIAQTDPIPVDYVFLNHTSFLREAMQQQFKEKTGVDRPHYDIRVIVDSYYQGALERISHVEYILHQAYPEPIQVRSQSRDHFLLKELANGEFVLVAKIFLCDQKQPLILQRYITLWKDGPRLEAGAE